MCVGMRQINIVDAHYYYYCYYSSVLSFPFSFLLVFVARISVSFILVVFVDSSMDPITVFAKPRTGGYNLGVRQED